VVSQW